jgi:hypothetical protein
VSNSSDRSALALLEQSKKNNEAKMYATIKKQNKTMSDEDARKRAALAASKIKALPRILCDNNVIQFDLDSSDDDENEENVIRPTKKRRIHE